MEEELYKKLSEEAKILGYNLEKATMSLSGVNKHMHELLEKTRDCDIQILVEEDTRRFDFTSMIKNGIETYKAIEEIEEYFNSHPMLSQEEIKKQLKHERNPMRIKELNAMLHGSGDGGAKRKSCTKKKRRK